ncbi:hypothetical protein C8Q73DRAFT_483028 [Cubamyces lactineus]|nr:hypothetical protein C8Q73DRAFT_483028 [Cubamyces lactineus]
MSPISSHFDDTTFTQDIDWISFIRSPELLHHSDPAASSNVQATSSSPDALVDGDMSGHVRSAQFTGMPSQDPEAYSYPDRLSPPPSRPLPLAHHGTSPPTDGQPTATLATATTSASGVQLHTAMRSRPYAWPPMRPQPPTAPTATFSPFSSIPLVPPADAQRHFPSGSPVAPCSFVGSTRSPDDRGLFNPQQGFPPSFSLSPLRTVGVVTPPATTAEVPARETLGKRPATDVDKENDHITRPVKRGRYSYISGDNLPLPDGGDSVNLDLSQNPSLPVPSPNSRFGQTDSSRPFYHAVELVRGDAYREERDVGGADDPPAIFAPSAQPSRVNLQAHPSTISTVDPASTDPPEPEPAPAPEESRQVVWDPATQGPYPGYDGHELRGAKRAQQARAARRKHVDPCPRPPSPDAQTQASSSEASKAPSQSSKTPARRKPPTRRTKPQRTKDRYRCPLCDKPIARQYDTDRHVISTHIVASITCAFCARTFVRLDSANRHFRARSCMGVRRHEAQIAAAKERLGVPRSESDSESGSESEDTPKRSTTAGTTRANKAVARAHLEIMLPCWNEKDAEGREYRALVAALTNRYRRTIKRLEGHLSAYGKLVHQCECCVPVQYDSEGDVHSDMDGDDDDEGVDEDSGEASEREFESEEDMPGSLRVRTAVRGPAQSTSQPQTSATAHRQFTEEDGATGASYDSLLSDGSLTELDSSAVAGEHDDAAGAAARNPANGDSARAHSESPDIPLAQVVARLRAQPRDGPAGGDTDASSAALAMSSIAAHAPHSPQPSIKQEPEEISSLASSPFADPRTSAPSYSQAPVNDSSHVNPGSNTPTYELPFLDSEGDFGDFFQEDLAPWAVAAAACPSLYPRETEDGQAPGAFGGYGGFDVSRFL